MGSFIAAKGAASLSKASHFVAGKTVPVVVRFSNGTGVPNLPDADPNASPHGIAIRFKLPGGANTDIVSISSNGFPVATPEEFVSLLQAIGMSGPGAAKPTPMEQFMGSHPVALKWATTPRPAPVSFGTLAFYGVNAFKFTNAKGQSHYVRYQIVPAGGERALSAIAAAKAGPNYLMDELPARIARGPVKFRLLAQVANEGDPTNDGSAVWPTERKLVELGTISLTKTAYQFQATRMERLLIGCYDAKDGGHFRPHRDNTTRGTAHWRFALSINLNDEFDGGELVFPEFGPRRCKVPAGCGVVFGCSLLHMMTPVVRGRRYALLPFLYDENAAALRQANERFVAGGCGASLTRDSPAGNLSGARMD